MVGLIYADSVRVYVWVYILYMFASCASYTRVEMMLGAHGASHHACRVVTQEHNIPGRVLTTEHLTHNNALGGGVLNMPVVGTRL